MEAVPKTIRYTDLCRELKEFTRGNTILSIVKDFFSVFWNAVALKQITDDELIAKAEILTIAVEAYENGDFSMDDVHQTLQKYEL
jgi:hypothetical protein